MVQGQIVLNGARMALLLFNFFKVILLSAKL